MLVVKVNLSQAFVQQLSFKSQIIRAKKEKKHKYTILLFCSFHLPSQKQVICKIKKYNFYPYEFSV